MNYRTDAFDDEGERLATLFRRAQDRDDYNNEMAGRDVGRQDRFLPADAQSSRASESKRAKRAEALTRLQLLMANQAYAEQFRLTARHLNEAQDRLDTLLERVRWEIELAQLALTEKRERAARLEDGTRIYLDQSGNIRMENGAQVADKLAAGVIWNGDEPSYESMQDDHGRIGRLRSIERDTHAGQSRIGEMQEDLKDNDDPKTEDEMNSLRGKADEIVQGLETRFEDTLPPPPESEASPSRPSSEVVGLAFPDP